MVIGGGLVGCEAAAELRAEGKDVTVVEMLPGIANGCGVAQSNALRTGMKARTDLADELQKATVPELYAIGDCVTARKMGDAIREGYYTAINI